MNALPNVPDVPNVAVAEQGAVRAADQSGSRSNVEPGFADDARTNSFGDGDVNGNGYGNGNGYDRGSGTGTVTGTGRRRVRQMGARQSPPRRRAGRK